MITHLLDCFAEKARNEISEATKIEWLRSQILGQFVEFETPLGKRLLTYADHTASGRSLMSIENFILYNVLPVYGNTHTDDSFVGRTTGNLVAQGHEYVKKCMGGTENEALLFCGSGCTAAVKRLQEVIGVAISPILRDRVLATLKEHERWVVFVGPYEHHSNLLSWRNSLVELVVNPLTADGHVDMVALKADLENPKYKGRPKLGSFSAGSNVTGLLTDTRSVARLLHAHGAYACFDFAACGPYVKIDMRSGQSDGYDAVYVSPHKFMGGPGTPGILLMSKKLYLLKDHPPSTCAGGTVNFVNFDEKNTLYYKDIEHREDGGTPAIIQKIRTALTYSVKEFLTPELIHSRESHFIETALSRLGKNPNVMVHGSLTAKRTAVLAFNTFTKPEVQRKNFSWYVSPTNAEVHPRNSPVISADRDTNTSSISDEEPWKERIEAHKLRSVNPTQPTTPERSPSPLLRKERMGGTSPARPGAVHSSKGRKSSLSKYISSKYTAMSLSPMMCVKPQATASEEAEQQQATPSDRGKPLEGRFIVTLLNDIFGIQARGGCSCAGPYGHSLLHVDGPQSQDIHTEIAKGFVGVKPGWARLSFGYYLSNEEFEYIVSAIEFIAEYGERFLALYDLNWKTGDWTFKVHDQEIQDLVSDLRNLEFGAKKQAQWLNHDLRFAPGCPLNVPAVAPEDYNTRLASPGSPFNGAALASDDYNAKLAGYLKVARYLAARLPNRGSSTRDIPSEVDQPVIMFRL